MKFVPSQCKQCPFRKSSAPGWLGAYDVGSVFRSIWHGVPFFCHPSIDYERPDWEERAMREGKLCTGGLVFANKMLAPESEHEAIRRARILVAGVPEIECMEPREFGKHHEGGLVVLKRRIG